MIRGSTPMNQSALFIVEGEVKYWWSVCSVALPGLFELSSEDLQVVEGPAHGKHHLSVIAGSHTDVPALRLLPFTH